MAATPNPAKFLAAAPVYNGTDGVVWTVALGDVSLVTIRTAGITVVVAVGWLVTVEGQIGLVNVAGSPVPPVHLGSRLIKTRQHVTY